MASKETTCSSKTETNTSNTSKQAETQPRKPSIPPFDTPEKIILVVDRCVEKNATFFTTTEESVSPLEMTKRVMNIFLRNKQFISPNSTYAVMFLNENSASWELDFTKSIDTVSKKINSATQCISEDVFQVGSIFKLTMDKIALSDPGNSSIPPEYVVRIILVFSRSFVRVKISEDVKLHIYNYINSPYLFIDIIYTHENAETANMCKFIAKKLHSLNLDGLSYFFPIERNILEFHNCMAKVLGHPLQRCPQKFANYELKINK